MPIWNAFTHSLFMFVFINSNGIRDSSSRWECLKNVLLGRGHVLYFNIRIVVWSISRKQLKKYIKLANWKCPPSEFQCKIRSQIFQILLQIKSWKKKDNRPPHDNFLQNGLLICMLGACSMFSSNLWTIAPTFQYINSIHSYRF